MRINIKILLHVEIDLLKEYVKNIVGVNI